jgi:hypothetical protein
MSEPEKPEDERRPTLIEKLTLVGRLLLLCTFGLFGTGFYYSLFFFHHNFPTGNYPVAFILIPVVIGCFLFFLIVAWILELCGIRIYARDSSR